MYAELTLENITLKNAQVGSTNEGGGVYIDNGGTLIMQGSTTITGCQTGGQGGGVFGSVEMQGGALVTPTSDKNDVFLLHSDKITVTGVLGHHPAARITPSNHSEGKVVVKGASAEEANFTVTPNGSETWRCEKVGDELRLKKN